VWLNSTETALQWLRNNGQDPNGHYGTLWGRGGTITNSPLTSWNLNDQAAVADAYLFTALPEPSACALAFSGGALALLRRSRRR
jgi:hypothetical protein